MLEYTEHNKYISSFLFGCQWLRSAARLTHADSPLPFTVRHSSSPLFNSAVHDPQKRKTTTISVEVKKSQHKYIIGPKGNTLQEILETTGVSVEMPQLDSGSETIILRGEPDKLGPALTQVYAKVRLALVKTPWQLLGDTYSIVTGEGKGQATEGLGTGTLHW